MTVSDGLFPMNTVNPKLNPSETGFPEKKS